MCHSHVPKFNVRGLSVPRLNESGLSVPRFLAYLAIKGILSSYFGLIKRPFIGQDERIKSEKCRDLGHPHNILEILTQKDVMLPKQASVEKRAIEEPCDLLDRYF